MYLDDSDKTLGSIEQNLSSLNVEMLSVQERLFLFVSWLNV